MAFFTGNGKSLSLNNNTCFSVFAAVFDRLNDFLFANGVFASFSKMEKIYLFKKEI